MCTFVFASDSLKGTLTSHQTAELLRAAADRHFPGCSCVEVPMADGGEGTVDALVAACGGKRHVVTVADPLGRPVEAAYGLLGQGRAVVEMAAASGLPLLAPGERNPLATSSAGTGQLILDALEHGCADVSLALGGSATNDGGMGMARALGVRFLGADGCELGGCGADLARVARIDASGLDPRVMEAHFTLMCDVDNPLLGPQGATAVFGPQKGATSQMVRELEAGMGNYARILRRDLGMDVDVPGAGAAGGLGAAGMAFLGGEVKSGIERVLELVGFRQALRSADLVVTGEGHCDAQTARGKVVSGVAAACREAGVPCVAVVGGMSADAAGLPGLAAVVPTAIDAMPLDEALTRAEELYALGADRLFSLLAAGATLERRRL